MGRARKFMSLTKEEQYSCQFCKNYVYQGKISAPDTEKNANILTAILVVCITIMTIIFMLVLQWSKWVIFAIELPVCIAIVALVLWLQNKDRTKSQRQYFMDENHRMYMVQFMYSTFDSADVLLFAENQLHSFKKRLETTKEIQNETNRNITKSRISAQSLETAYYYVLRYRKGIKDWNMWSGGSAKVVLLDEFNLIQTGKKTSKYSYKKNGRKKVVRISNDYVGLSKAFA